ncbi:transporter substrate-binding domain-containing protein [Clostridium aestuarii]|uniref:Transporter substrate-binding domain-containing protein n=1 Tax=Clostridium aestuarii TaxID=338193 RepID=A0ABT4CVB5_9CLOT|nr:transporter substrate-binding domain-containing protein [Clostridium aestuarii]MCY6482925.1 transporter substrate-binding domain-containing protein [Clostridium aestuarii]
MNIFIKKSTFLFILIITLFLCSSFAYNTKANSYNKIDKIKVVLGSDYPPYVFRDSNGNLQGIAIDQWNLWETRTGIAVELHVTSWAEALNLMAKGEFDVIDTIYFNHEREKIYSFSKPYAKIEVPIFFNKNISGITGTDTLKGFSVGVIAGDNSINFLKEKGINEFQQYDSYEDLLNAAKNNKVVVFVADKPSSLYHMYKLKIQDKFNYSTPLYTGNLNRAVKKGNTQLLKTIEDGFSLISSAEYKKIDRKWLGTPFVIPKFIHYIIIISIIIMSILFLLIFWNRTLNKKVKQKTSELTMLIKEISISEEKYRELLRSLNIGIIVYSSTGEILICNKAYLKLLGLPNKKYLNETFLNSVGYFSHENGNLFTIDDYPATKVIKTKMPIRDYTIGIRRTPSEDILWVQVDAFPKFDINNKLIKVIVTFVDITERKKAETHIYQMSIHDSLTELKNRNFFENQLKKYQTKDLPNLAMVICDVDGLKLINDTLGHSVGDEYLCATANILRSCFRKQDLIARIGGDEFGILMENTTSEEIEKIRVDINEFIKNINSHNKVVPLSISLGYELYKKEYKNLGELFKVADNYMYREKLHHQQSAKSEIVNVLMKMLEARDFITEGHGERLQELAVKLAESIGMTDNKIKDIGLLGQFHDIGKVGISDTILFKPGRLTKEEATEMKKHTEIGYRIAKSTPDLMHISDWIFKHHEWWDGNGYPLGIKAEDIPIQCRILSIVDTYDAMTNDRPYRKALPKEVALEEIKHCAGTQFDPILVDKFIAIMNEEIE